MVLVVLETTLIGLFIGESMISKETIKLAVTLGEAPRMATIVIDFLVVNCLSAYNGVLGRPLLRTLKAIMSVHCLTMKFPITTGTGQVQGRQWDSRECYNKSLKLAKKRKKLPQTTEVEKTSIGPMETNIDPRLQEDGSTARPVKKLIDIQVDPNEPSHVIKIRKGLSKKLARQLMEFLRHN